jgi:hypothetical protein
MKRFFPLLIFLLFDLARLHAQSDNYGLGIIVGEPTGISGKVWVSSRNAVDGGIAWSFAKESSVHIHADYLWHFFDVFKTDLRLPLYAGVGGRIKLGKGDQSRVGVRFVGGINLHLTEAPFDFFLELAPIMDLAPATRLGLNGGIGARYFFE